MEQELEARSPKLPGDVAAKLADSTKSFNRDRLVKLLRDTHYLGPIPVGRGPKKSDGHTTGSPGSGMRRSRDGALYKANKSMRQAVLDRALETDLIVEVKGGYASTPKGVDVLEMLDTCDECGQQREPYLNEYTVQISRHNTATNYRLVTVCDECGHDYRGSLREDFRSYAGADRDEAIQTLKNLDDPDRVNLNGVCVEDIDQWISPSERAAKEVRELLERDGHNSYDLSTAIFSVGRKYVDEWVPGAAEILADDYDEQTLAYAVLKTLAREEEFEDPAEDIDYSELEKPYPRLLPGEAIKATFEIEAIGREVTLIFTSDEFGKVPKFEDEDSGLSLLLTTTRHARRGTPVVKSHKAGVLGQVVDLEVVSLTEDTTETELEKIDAASDRWQRKLDSSMRGTVANEKAFKKIATKEDLTPAETIAFARIARHMNRERDKHVGEYLDEFAKRNLNE